MIDLSKQDILNYVLKTPYNTNPSVLSSLLDNITEKAPTPTLKEINFFDYDGALLYSYTRDELRAQNKMPPLPQRPGLICQGWNYLLNELLDSDAPCSVGAMYITDDGTTRVYIHLNQGRTSPMLGVGVAGTVTVDWGDGTEPDILTGSNVQTIQWTLNHEYSKSGDYVIKLSVDGLMQIIGNDDGNSCLLRHVTSNDNRNTVYQNAIRKIELGDKVQLAYKAFSNLNSLNSIIIPQDAAVNSSGAYAFFQNYGLKAAILPRGWAVISNYMFAHCCSLEVVSIPHSTSKIDSFGFQYCYSLSFITFPSTVRAISSSAFTGCNTLPFIDVPSGVTTINDQTFNGCISATYVKFRGPITTFAPNALYAAGASFVDLSACTVVPTIVKSGAFAVPSDCEIRVPKNLRDEWATANNWTGFANQIVGV